MVDYKECKIQNQEESDFARVGMIVTELASRGQMFDYLKQGGGLDEQITRFYAQ